MAIASGLSALVLWTASAVLAAGAGALAARRLSPRALGWASASAAGLMLGVAYVVMTAGLDLAPVAGSVAAALGIALLHALHSLPGMGATAAEPAGVAPAAAEPRHAVAASAVHSAPEGVAIGVAMAMEPRLGVVLALTLAVHNVAEGALLGAELAARGIGAGRAVGLALLAKSSQLVLAAATLALVAAAPAALPWALGAAFGALVYLILAELLPESYRHAGRTGIALVVSLAAGIVGLLGGTR